MPHGEGCSEDALEQTSMCCGAAEHEYAEGFCAACREGTGFELFCGDCGEIATVIDDATLPRPPRIRIKVKKAAT